MKKITLLFFTLVIFSGIAKAQQDVGGCNVEKQKIDDKISRLRYDKQVALKELEDGYFCSKCMKSKSQIEKTGEGFEAHLGRVKGERVPATAQQKADNQRNFDDQIASLESESQSKKSDCDRMSEENEKAAQEARKEAQDKANDLAKQRMDAQAEANRQAAEAARQRQEEANLKAKAIYDQFVADEKRRQDQLAANQANYQGQMNQIGSDTQAKLDAFKQTSKLDDNNNSADTKNAAQSVISSTSSSNLGQQAFGGSSGSFLKEDDPNAQQDNNVAKNFDNTLAGTDYSPADKGAIKELSQFTPDPEKAISVFNFNQEDEPEKAAEPTTTEEKKSYFAEALDKIRDKGNEKVQEIEVKLGVLTDAQSEDIQRKQDYMKGTLNEVGNNIYNSNAPENVAKYMNDNAITLIPHGSDFKDANDKVTSFNEKVSNAMANPQVALQNFKDWAYNHKGVIVSVTYITAESIAVATPVGLLVVAGGFLFDKANDNYHWTR